jgi:putative ABC transport system permease protein
MSSFWLDVRFAGRIFRRRPGFTTVAVLTLALGIGAATAVFSIVDAVLLRPLPYRSPDRLTAIWLTSLREKGLAKIFATYADYLEFRRSSTTLESVAAATWATRVGRILTGQGAAREIVTIPAAASFFDTLGVQAAIGRTFRDDDEGHGCTLVLSHRLWAGTLGADASLIGKSLTFDQQPCKVLGVMPERFGFYPPQAQAWVLLDREFQAQQDRLMVGIFGRLKPGATLAGTEAELRRLYRARHADPETRDFEPVVYDLHGEFTFLAGRTLRTTLVLVFAAVLFLLLLTCLNVANLLLARLSERQREFAVRAALGSGRGRLIRQVLVEGLSFAGAGSALGVGMAYGALQYFRSANPIELSVGADVRVSPAVLGFGVLLSAATTLIFGLLPAFRASKVDLTEHLKAGRGAVQGRRGLGRAVIAVEMALSFLLLAGAGLFLTSALRMGSESMGFRPEGLLATRVSLPASRYATEAQRIRAYDQLLAGLERLPGVTRAALASKMPPDAGGSSVLAIQGRAPASGGEMHDVGAESVSPGFFDALGIPLRRGRLFTEQDRANAQPVAIVNEALAQKYFPNADPLGQQIRIPGGSMPWLTIAGVVGNVKHGHLMNEMSWVETPLFYRPLAQDARGSVQIAVHVAGSRPMAQAVQNQISALDPFIPVSEVETLVSRLGKTLAYPRFRAVVLSFFALGALILSAVGLHGLLSQLVAQRIPEFGVRRAVGAQTRDLLWLVARQGGGPVVAGLGVGLGLTIALRRVVSNLLYGIEAANPVALTLTSVVLLAVAGLAITLPARRAVRVDPMTALRTE